MRKLFDQWEFDITPDFLARCVIGYPFVAGKIFHVARNEFGGACQTPIAHFFAWVPESSENYHPHWRIDCTVWEHRLAPAPEVIGVQLADTLLREGLCTEPLHASWHRASDSGYKLYGDVVNYDDN